MKTLKLTTPTGKIKIEAKRITKDGYEGYSTKIESESGKITNLPAVYKTEDHALDNAVNYISACGYQI